MAGRGSLLRVLALLAALLPWPAAAQPDYTFAVVPQFEQRKLFAIWKPIVDRIQASTGLSLRLVATLTVPDFEASLSAGEFDFVYTNPYHILRESTRQGYIPLVRDAAPLRGILVVPKDSPIHDVRDLAGKTLAIPSPNALGASMLLRADLRSLYGIEMKLLNAKTHSSAYLHAATGLADAAGGVEKSLQEQDPALRDSLRVLYTTRDMPSHPVAAHPRVPAQAREAVRKALLDMAATPEGAALLAAVPMSRPVPATIADYQVMSGWGLDSLWVGL